ncbi:MAG: FAD binding domain-containing protein [Spirochaetales bacterium]
MAADQSTVYFPDTLGELLQLYRREPQALLYAGGSYLLSQRTTRFPVFPPVVISLQDVEELRRVARTERYVEIGAALPIRQILKLGKNNIPLAFYSALRNIGPPAVIGLATLGGNIAVPGRTLTCVPVLSLLESRVELRRQGSNRWIPVARMHRANGTLELEPGEIITRVRIPLQAWTLQLFRKFGSELAPDSEPLSFCGLVRSSNGIIEELRIVGSAGQPETVRSKEMESELVGRRLPLGHRDVRTAVAAYGPKIENLSAIQRDRFVRLVHSFLASIRTQ